MSSLGHTTIGAGEAAGASSEVQKGLNAQRDAIQKQQAAEGTRAGYVRKPDAQPSGADVSTTRASIPGMHGIEFRDDRFATAEDRTGRKHRTATVKCLFCAGTTILHQTTNPSDPTEWSPDIAKTISLVGWQSNDEHWFCGKTCLERHAFKMREHGHEALIPATRVAPPNAARLAYQTQTVVTVDAPNAIDAQELTPAAPPQTSAPRRNGRPVPSNAT